jgi:predicted benzoate:H+ symporter BenE
VSNGRWLLRRPHRWLSATALSFVLLVAVVVAAVVAGVAVTPVEMVVAVVGLAPLVQRVKARAAAEAKSDQKQRSAGPMTTERVDSRRTALL